MNAACRLQLRGDVTEGSVERHDLGQKGEVPRRHPLVRVEDLLGGRGVAVVVERVRRCPCAKSTPPSPPIFCSSGFLAILHFSYRCYLCYLLPKILESFCLKMLREVKVRLAEMEGEACLYEVVVAALREDGKRDRCAKAIC